MAMREKIVLDKDVYTLALERADHVLSTFDHVAVAFSGGKDSTATLNIMLEAAHANPKHARHLPLRVIHYDEEAIPFETEAYVRRTAQRPDVQLEWYCLPVRHRNACSRRHPFWWPWAPEDKHKWVRELPPEAITEWPGFPINPPEARLTAPDTTGLFFPRSLGNVALCMGIRAAESLTRTRAVSMRAGGENYIVQDSAKNADGNVFKVYPVYDWSHKDIWTAFNEKGWDYNKAYDLLAMNGIPLAMQRCSPAFGEEPLQTIDNFAKCFPDVWAKMSERVPGISAAFRYSRTELYAYGTKPEKPAGVPWNEFVKHFIGKYAPEHQHIITDRLHHEIRLHYRKTTDPILPHARHPKTGVSWDYLLSLSMRGDFKNRRPPGGGINTKDEAKLWRKYAADAQRVIDEGTVDELSYPGAMPERGEDFVPPEFRENQ